MDQSHFVVVLAIVVLFVVVTAFVANLISIRRQHDGEATRNGGPNASLQ